MSLKIKDINIIKLNSLDEFKYVYTQSYETGNPDAPLVPLEELSNDSIRVLYERRKEDTYICYKGVKEIIGFVTMSSYLDGLNLGIHLDTKFRGHGMSHILMGEFISNNVLKDTPIYVATFEGNNAAIAVIKKMGGVLIEKKELPSRTNHSNSIIYLFFRL